MDTGYFVIILLFIVYYVLILVFEKKIMKDPSEIIENFLSIILMYAGISLIYFSLTGKSLFNDSPSIYTIYIFIMGFIALLWTIPNLLENFKFFRKFIKNKKIIKKIIEQH